MKVGILGGGQLARMLALAGIPLGHRFTFLEPSPDPSAGALGEVVRTAYDDPEGLARMVENADVVTFEFENVPAKSAAYLQSQLPVLPPPQALEASQDRVAEKRLFKRAGIPTAACSPVDHPADLDAALQVTGVPAVVKTRRFGYDGKGQAVVRGASEALAAVDALGPGLIVESFVDFRRELSIVAVAGQDGDRVFYPLAENHHRGGILRLSYAPAPALSPGLQARAERMADRVIDLLDYTGVLAIELFETTGGRLIANEMAPRVHNSGHWTIDGAAASQFENHVRAVTGLPLAAPAPVRPTVMVNLIGPLPDIPALAATRGAHLHLYDKTPRPGRKLGHVNITGEDPAAVVAAAKSVWGSLPRESQAADPSDRRFPLRSLRG